MNPGGHGGVYVVHLIVSAPENAAGHSNGGQRVETHVLRVGIAALDGLLHLDLHVALFVFAVQKHGTAKAGVVRNQVLGGGFRKKRLPGKALVLIAGQNHAHTGGLALGDDFDVDVIIHVFFLSQPFSSGVQKQHSAGCFIGQIP